jgi:acyl dehydratase
MAAEGPLDNGRPTKAPPNRLSAMDGPRLFLPWDRLASRVGDDFGCSSWVHVDQPTIDAFAKTTGDEYFLHVDPVRAEAELPFGGTIAHGLYTLALLPRLSYEVCPHVEGARTPLNFGFDRVRFVAPVPVGARVRGRFVLAHAAVPKQGQCELCWDTTVEIEGADRPALVAAWRTRFLL